MDRLFANGTVNAAQSGDGPPLFLFHSLLSDRASFDAIAPNLSRSFRVIVPELPGFGRSPAVVGGLAAVADRMAEAVKDAAGGKDADRARQRLWRVRRVADGHPPSRDCGQIRSGRLRRGVLGTGPRSLSQHGGGVKSQGPRRDHRCRDAPAICAGIPGRASRFDARSPRGVSENRSAKCFAPPAPRWPNSTCGPNLRRSKSRCWCWSASMTRRRRRRCRTNWRRGLPRRGFSHSGLRPCAATAIARSCSSRRSAIFCRQVRSRPEPRGNQRSKSTTTVLLTI